MVPISKRGRPQLGGVPGGATQDTAAPRRPKRWNFRFFDTPGSGDAALRSPDSRDASWRIMKVMLNEYRPRR
jgi:hypothetical protein